jgi:hypothetical protein
MEGVKGGVKGKVNGGVNGGVKVGVRVRRRGQGRSKMVERSKIERKGKGKDKNERKGQGRDKGFILLTRQAKQHLILTACRRVVTLLIGEVVLDISIVGMMRLNLTV